LTISNNFIAGVNGSNWSSFGSSSSMGIVIGAIGNSSTLTTAAGGINLYYNSVSMTGSMGSGSTSATTAAIYIGSGASGLDIRNNIFSNTQTATSTTQKNYAIYSATGGSAFTQINYNDYYVLNSFNASSAIVGFLTSDRLALTDWQTATGKDANSKSLDPMFISSTDLHINTGNGVLDNLGTPITGITIDIDADTRSTTTPDIGADEFTATACNGTSGGTAVYSGSVICTSGSATITASGYPTGSSVTYQWEYSADNFGSDIHDLSGQQNPATASTGTITSTTYYRLRTTCTVTSTIWYSNVITITVTSPSISGTTPAARCGVGTVTLQATGSGGADINWYTSSTGGVPVATGNSYTTPVISTTTTYYAAANSGGSTYNLGKANTTGSDGSNTATGAYLIFDAYTPFTLNSVVIYPYGSGGAGTATIALQNSSGTTVQSSVISISSTSTASNPVPVIANLGFAVPAGTNYRLTLTAVSGSVTGLYRDLSATYPYPYTVTGVASITSSSLGSGYYYHFYNWTISTGCESARTPVTATVTPAPAVSISPSSAEICSGSNVTLTASSVTNPSYTYTWTPGNVTGASQTFNPSSTITYTVTALDNTSGTYAGCTTTATAIVTTDPVPAAVSVTPSSSANCYGTVQQLTASGGTYNATEFSENFNAATNSWTKTNTSTGGVPSNADWTLRPNNYSYSVFYYDAFLDDYYYYDYKFKNADSSQFYLTNGDAQGSAGTSHTTITSPAINTTGYQSLTLQFNQNFEPYTTADSAMVQVSTDGVNFVNVAKYISEQGSSNYVSYYYDGNFYEHDIYNQTFASTSISLNSYINKPTLYIRFKYEAVYGNWWAVDNVSISGVHGATIAWSPSTGLYTNAAATIPYTGGTANSVYANVTTTHTYTASATNDIGCASTGTGTVSLSAAYSWTGYSNTNWNTSANWCNDTVPYSSVDVTIASVPNEPVLPFDVTVHNLDIATNAWLNLNGHAITVNGALNSTGTTGKFQGSTTSGLTVNGGGTAYFDTTNKRNTLKTLSTGGSSATTLIIGDTLNITPGNSTDGYGTVTATAGTIASAGKLVLKSNSQGTARVTISTGKITGDVTVERFIPARRAWRFLSVPFSSSSQSIRDAWQEGVNNYGLGAAYNQNPHPGYGTHITGNNYSNLGFDYNVTTNPSMKVWDSSTSAWNISEPATISTKITDYKAYCLFVRGSRAVDLSMGSYATADSTVLRARGVLNQTGFTASKTYAGRDSAIIFVGNPYASSIDLYNGGSGLLSSGRVSGIDKGKFWVWDPRDSGLYGVGGYVSFSNGVQVPFKGNTNATYAAGTIIQNGQAFMVQLSKGSTGATIGFQEDDKVVSETNVFGKKANKQVPSIYINLMVPQADGSFSLTDGVGAGFDSKYSAEVDEYDAVKLWNFDENITLVRNTRTLAIEFRPKPILTDTLFLRMYLRQQPYTLQVFSQNLPGNLPARAWIVDKYLNTQTEINLYDTTLYNFSPNPDTNSYRNRFMLVFNRQMQGNPVPVTKAIDQNNPNVTGEANSLAVTDGDLSLYPNPVSKNRVMLQFKNMMKGSYAITIYSIKGQKLSTRIMQHDGGSAAYPLPLNASWANGMYTVTIINQDSKNETNLKLVINK
ncbi:MAG: T9SS type A sorting domain-containing protein, partial [Parafilimonas sp.]|nr:T9SS type A sorting domain-containing protein [Parafilimonas sp.]